MLFLRLVCKINEISQCSYQNSGLWSLFLSVWSPWKAAAIQAKNSLGRARDISWAVQCSQEPWVPPSAHVLWFAPSGVVIWLCMNLQDWLSLLLSSWPFLLSCQDLEFLIWSEAPQLPRNRAMVEVQAGDQESWNKGTDFTSCHLS